MISIAALILLSRLGSVISDMGGGYELRALTAAVIGGVSLDGAKGSVIGAFVGVLLVGILTNGLNIIGISSYYHNTIMGIVMVTAVVLSNMGNIRRLAAQR